MENRVCLKNVLFADYSRTAHLRPIRPCLEGPINVLRTSQVNTICSSVNPCSIWTLLYGCIVLVESSQKCSLIIKSSICRSYLNIQRVRDTNIDSKYRERVGVFVCVIMTHPYFLGSRQEDGTAT